MCSQRRRWINTWHVLTAAILNQQEHVLSADILDQQLNELSATTLNQKVSTAFLNH
jgi:hypothetical protein